MYFLFVFFSLFYVLFHEISHKNRSILVKQYLLRMNVLQISYCITLTDENSKIMDMEN